MLRKVMVTNYITRPMSAQASDAERGITGRSTSTWEEGEALFHGFGSDYEEFENGPGNFSIAIVEWPTGQVEMVRADKIRFLSPIVTGVDLSNGGDRASVVHVSKEEGRVIVHDLRTAP
jgi:hypothetical protein